MVELLPGRRPASSRAVQEAHCILRRWSSIPAADDDGREPCRKNRWSRRLRGRAAPHRQLPGMVARKEIYSADARMGGRRHAADGARHSRGKTARAEVCARHWHDSRAPDCAHRAAAWRARWRRTGGGKARMRQGFEARVQELRPGQGQLPGHGTGFCLVGRRAAL